MTHHELRYLLQKMFPDSVYGQDYFTGHYLDKAGNGAEQVGEAFILKWNLPAPQPSEAQLQAWWGGHQKEVLATMKADHMRWQRSTKLAEADILVEKAKDRGDAESEQKARTYRQALRDVTLQPGFPDTFDWPEIPT